MDSNNQRTQETTMNANKITYGCTAGLNVVAVKTVGTTLIGDELFAIEDMIRQVGRTWYVDRRVVDGECQGGTVGFKTKRAAMAALNS